jgi:hypothetical protein
MASSKARKENLDKLTKRFQQLRSDCLKRGLGDDQLRKTVTAEIQINSTSFCESSAKTPTESTTGKTDDFVDKITLGPIFFDAKYATHAIVAFITVIVTSFFASVYFLTDFVISNPCVVPASGSIVFEEVFRPLVDCDLCKDMYSVHVERNISSLDFYNKYAFSGR